VIHKPVNRYYSGFRAFVSVMRGLVPRIHVFRAATKTWMTGTSPVMTISNSIRPTPALSAASTRPLLHILETIAYTVASDPAAGRARKVCRKYQCAVAIATEKIQSRLPRGVWINAKTGAPFGVAELQRRMHQIRAQNCFFAAAGKPDDELARCVWPGAGSMPMHSENPARSSIRSACPAATMGNTLSEMKSPVLARLVTPASERQYSHSRREMRYRAFGKVGTHLPPASLVFHPT